MKTRSKVFLGWIGLELLALPFAIPAAALFKNKISFESPKRIITVPMPSDAGQSVFLVASDSPFAVISSGATTELSVSVEQSGKYKGVSFGSKAKMPGAAQACAVTNTLTSSRIYTAGRKTAARRGSPQDRAVKITVNYDAKLSPDISIVSMDDARERHIVLAFPCNVNPAIGGA